ncbi:MAG: transposase [Bacteroidetes bacterium]|nr:MAG: transposase [Bacteroidota bacterium]
MAPKDIKAIFPKVFKRLQRSKELEKFLFMGKYYLVSGDGTEYFKSNKIGCGNCLQRNLKDGSKQNHHQFYGAAIVHPDIRQVVPLAPEPIVKQDGGTKNDCERNASKRWLADFRKAHPKLPGVVIEDALSSNAPHIREIKGRNLRFILGVKESDHGFLFGHVKSEKKSGNVTEHTITQGDKTHIFSFINNVPLNKSNQDLLLNFLEYWEVNNKTGKTQHFSWVTDLKLKIKNVYDIMRGGRARWKIENETFNTLKNHDYHFGHNYGHGKKNLSVNLALLMMLAFLIDQTLEISCNLFRGALKENGARIRLWSEIRELFNTYLFDSMNQIYEAVLFGYEKKGIRILDSG